MSEFCFVCNGKEGVEVKKLSELKSKYTNQLITKIIDGILDDFPTSRQTDDNWNSICIFCLDKVDDYAFHFRSADLQRKRLRNRLMETEKLLKTDDDKEVSEIMDLSASNPNEDWNWFDSTFRPDSPDWSDPSQAHDKVIKIEKKLKPRKYLTKATDAWRKYTYGIQQFDVSFRVLTHNFE